ncbi:MAG: hypothetical protein MUF83_08220 [Acidimicrobiales bacterium]|jgi:hypothetical protein|nr:hypothetical protein [Acidimicrobiales bacterium]
MAKSEARALAEVATESSTFGARSVQHVHRSIAGRVWRVAGPVAAPVRVFHDPISAVVHTSVRVGLHVGGTAAGLALGAASHLAGWGPVSDTPTGDFTIGVLNGFAGDRLHRVASPLAFELSLRHEGRTIDPDRLGEALPTAGGDVVVFLHGLVETDRSWTWGSERYHGRPGVSFGSRLADDLGMTPLYVRYNTGRRVGENGAELDQLLEAVVGAWPVPVERLTLVGHSMGGLVVRSALHRGEARGAAWTDSVRQAVYLGTPHLGAPLARGVHHLGQALGSLPETRPFARVLHRPGTGIDDLRHGTVWAGDDEGDPDRWFVGDLHELPLAASCRHNALAVCLSERPESLSGRLVGDLLVETTSATGRGRGDRRIAFDPQDCAAVGGLSHFALLNHPTVYDQLLAWLARDPVRSVAATGPGNPSDPTDQPQDGDHAQGHDGDEDEHQQPLAGT